MFEKLKGKGAELLVTLTATGMLLIDWLDEDE